MLCQFWNSHGTAHDTAVCNAFRQTMWIFNSEEGFADQWFMIWGSP
jgi:hypothetical protein